jgi:SAM-dependent methyltransferase
MDVTGTPGELYEQHMIPAIFARWAPDLVEAVGLRPGERVLDVACGTGIVTRLLPDRVGPTGRVVGLDINPGMLAAARTAAPQALIEWLEGNVLGMPLPDAAFDAVVCQQGFQFFPDKLAAQGPDVLDAIVAEVTNATRDYVDDEGWAASQATNIITAVV